jgi:hypothetical protein
VSLRSINRLKEKPMPIQRTGLASRFGRAVSGVRIAILFKAGVSMIVLLLCCAASNAQTHRFQFGLDFTTVIPTGDFSKNVTNNGYGVGAQFLVGLGRLPLLLGGDLSPCHIWC